MKTNWGIFIIAGLLLTSGSLPAVTNDLSTALQRGLFEEEANHNLDAAIPAYQSVITQYDKDRKLAATAIFRLGESYRKQGKTNEAIAQYERVLREFPDQAPLLDPSRQNLATLGQTRSPSDRELSSTARQEQKRLYEEEIKLAEAQLATQQKQVQVGKLAPDELIPAKRDLLELKRKLAALDSGLPGAETGSQPGVGLTSVEAEEVKRIQTMIKDSPDLINARDNTSTKATPLHRAAAAGQLVVAEFLLKNGAEIEAKSLDGRTPLHFAASAGQRSMVELLLANKASVQATDREGYTPLHLAAQKGMRSVCELLLARGADVNARTRRNVTPLHLAVANSFESIAALLIDHHAELDLATESVTSETGTLSGTALNIAAEKGDEPITALLLAKKANVNVFDESGQTPLHNAALKGYVGTAKQLIAHGADVNEKILNRGRAGWTALDCAVTQNKKEMVELLLANKADPNAKFDVGTNPNERGVTPLIMAASKGSTEILDLLLKANADPNLRSDNGRTPILEALQNSGSIKEREKMMQLLLERGADANSRVISTDANPRGTEQATPLMLAVYSGDKEIVELLLAHKADVKARDKNGRSALHYAAWGLQSGKETTSIAELLLAAGADVNASANGMTPLKWSVAIGGPVAEKMTALLREHGALEAVPRPDLIQIGRSGSKSSGMLSNGTNNWNQFTFLEVFAMENGILTKNPQGEVQKNFQTRDWSVQQQSFAFPNLEKVRVRRPASDMKSWQDKVIDVSAALASGDCSKDFRLEWGDIVEIAEADHPLNQTWSGFSTTEWTNLKKCLSREIEVIVKGNSTKVILAPGVNLLTYTVPMIETMTPFWIKPALRKTNLLLASSDLANIRVKRVDPATGTKREWLLDCSDSKPAPDFWLRDGDVIEVPDKT